MNPDRRQKRSEYTCVALSYWLDAIAERETLTSVVLADSSGLVIAASNPSEEAEDVAAVAAIQAAGGSVDLPFDEANLQIHPIDFGYDLVLLCSTGEPERSTASLEIAEHGVRRILTPQVH